MLRDNIHQYPPELLSIIGSMIITNMEGFIMMTQISRGQVQAVSDVSVKDGEDMPSAFQIIVSQM